MGGIIGFRTPQYRKKFGKYRNIAKKKKCQDTATLQYRVKNRCHTETTTLFVTFRADNTEMVIIRIC